MSFFYSHQVWRGALLLADFILSKPATFRGATVLELGAGTGLTSIIMATIAKTVYCTGVGEDLSKGMFPLEVQYESHNYVILHSLTSKQKKYLDLFFVSPVCYDDDLTDGLFRTLYQLCSNFTHTCTVFISIEKRMNFTLQHMDVSCEAYDHFRHCLSQLHDLVDGRCSFSVEQLPSNFAQFLLYERIEQLELWKVIVTPLPFDPV
ncbi:methyltransferase-like protein 22 [Morone saxatilis]|uniref:methyltransferase-like protein 22 n=1 Tax=Morone saxatilis TaxID=34816 RepID=UPI0015E23F08|nr:methyltransferase-like protein 22 [Morone saxatilis]